MSIENTFKKRKSMLNKARLTEEEQEFIKKLKLENK